MAQGQRTTKGSGRRLPSQRSLRGRTGYFPVRTGRKRGFPTLSQSGKPNVPADFDGTAPEYALFLAALGLGLKDHTDFERKYPIGESEVDYIFPPVPGGRIVEVQGLFWHFNFGGFAAVNDRERKARLLAAGYEYVAIDEDNLVGPRADPEFYLRAALEGRDYSRAGL